MYSIMHSCKLKKKAFYKDMHFKSVHICSCKYVSLLLRGVHAHYKDYEGSDNQGVDRRRQRKGLAQTAILNALETVGCD